MILYVAVLFFVLTPGILVSLPAGGSKTTVALVHSLVFALVFWATHKIVWKMTRKVGFGNLEGFNHHDDDGEHEGMTGPFASYFSGSSLSGASPYAFNKSK
jgi:hypothetical protein